jgi:glycosyltransferase involved in cell wall biosynthesis
MCSSKIPAMKSISVIIPLYNEKDSLVELYQGVVAEISLHTSDYEILFVDDGSVDGSFETLLELQSRDPHVRILRLRRNFGKSAALAAGFRMAKGDIIITLDADLQDQPKEMGKLLAKLDEGYDLVSGWKKDRKDSFKKRTASRIFNWTTSLLTGVPLHDINCGFKAYRRRVIEEIKVYGEMHRFIPVLASYRGFRVGEVPVLHRARPYGKSKYGATRMFGGFFDLLTVIMLTRYNSKPLHIFGILGILSFTIGFLIEAYLTYGWLVHDRWIENRPAFMLGILLLIIGVQFIFFGLLAEMIAYTAKREDDYSIRQFLAVESGDAERSAVVYLGK